MSDEKLVIDDIDGPVRFEFSKSKIGGGTIEIRHYAFKFSEPLTIAIIDRGQAHLLMLYL